MLEVGLSRYGVCDHWIESFFFFSFFSFYFLVQTFLKA